MKLRYLMQYIYKYIYKFYQIHLPVEAEWYLGMNLNPDDGHIMDYTTGWDDGYNIGSASTALVKDYLSSEVWDIPVNNIAIVRHQNVCNVKDLLIQLRNHILLLVKKELFCVSVSSKTTEYFLIDLCIIPLTPGAKTKKSCILKQHSYLLRDV